MPGYVDKKLVRRAVKDLLWAIGEDPDREGLRDTPDRVARFWTEFIEYDAGAPRTFEAAQVDQMVVVTGLRVWSMCEHHLLPFWCDVSVGYVTRERVLGLSKFARIAQHHAHRLQLQERLVHGVADDVATAADTPDVAVMAVGEHQCMTMRGVRSPHRMVSTSVRGVFKDHDATRAEFLAVVGAQAGP